MATIQHPSNMVYQSVRLTDDVKINLQYDIHRGWLNIFVKNLGDKKILPCHINVLSDQNETIGSATNLLDFPDTEPMICYEISTTYSYDLTPEDEDLPEIDFNQTMIISSSSSCSDVQTLDNDDGYSTHSHDDTESTQQQQQQLSLMIPPVKSLRPSFSFSSHHSTCEQYVLSVRRLIEHMTWFNPLKKTIQQMMINEIFA